MNNTTNKHKSFSRAPLVAVISVSLLLGAVLGYAAVYYVNIVLPYSDFMLLCKVVVERGIAIILAYGASSYLFDVAIRKKKLHVRHITKIIVISSFPVGYFIGSVVCVYLLQ